MMMMSKADDVACFFNPSLLLHLFFCMSVTSGSQAAIAFDTESFKGSLVVVEQTPCFTHRSGIEFERALLFGKRCGPL